MGRKHIHTHTSSTLLYSSIIRLYPQNPVFEIVHDESVKVYLHIHVQRDVQQNPLCVESCVTVYSFYPRSHCWLMNTNAARQECATLIIFVHYVRTELQADAAPMLWFADSKFHDF